MSLEKGLNIVDDALNIAIFDLERRGISKDDAQIALLLRLRAMVSPEVVKVAELLSEDSELNSAINGEAGPESMVARSF
ncbi:MAG: hypothetical protein VW124_09890 [Paracoccaceae bacterium]